VISASLQACGVVFPFAISTSICRSKFTICSGLYLFMGMTGLPPGEFSLISPGTKIPGQVTEIGAEFLFQVIAERAERATLIVTTNLPFSEWTQVFPNPRLCKALLDRITDRAHIIETGTESYRFRRTVEGRQKKKAS